MNQLHERRKTRILLVEPNLLVRQGMKTLLSAEADFDVIEEASELTNVFETAVKTGPDILILDLAIAQASTGELLAVRQVVPGMRILLLTKADGPEQLEGAIACGANAYMLKSSVSGQLVWAVRALRNENTSENGAGLSQTVSDLQALGKQHHRFPSGPVLTPRESETLKYVATGKTVREIAAELMLSPKTVEAHKLNLMRKLNVHTRAALIEYAVEHALIDEVCSA